jgi:hypothetical protein
LGRTHGGYVNIGQELVGSQGAIASLATFADNLVYDNTFRRRYATELDWRLAPDITKPSEGAEKPPYGTWLLQPAAGNRGGEAATYCCVE